jgi:glyoxylase-like metal-dependent hydrolase (beta-lactamase superfamily II)
LDVDRVFSELGLMVLERGWLSSNNILFRGSADAPATAVDTGYVAHAEQTCALLAHRLGGEGLGRVLNTHLHSDHCGGNAALQARWGCEVWVPEPSLGAVERWDQGLLTFEATGQRCERFSAQRALRVGESLRLGHADWQVFAAPGHDPDAVLLFEPTSRVVITADALWADRVAINFPELAGEPGFGEARAALRTIEQFEPRICIPGHGAPFTDVEGAIGRSRRRLEQFEAEPLKHLAYAERALTMFHMLERQSQHRLGLVAWLAAAPIFQGVLGRLTTVDIAAEERAQLVVDRLVCDGLLRRDEQDCLYVA